MYMRQTLGSSINESPAFSGPFNNGCRRRLCKSRYCRAHAMALVCALFADKQMFRYRTLCKSFRVIAWCNVFANFAKRICTTSSHLEILQATPLGSCFRSHFSDTCFDRLQLHLVL